MTQGDLSRFGRDYITVGSYVSRVFPFLGVRFIAVNDHIDSIRKGDIDSLDTSFKAIIYDMYSRDLSQKVRSAKHQLAKNGVYINPVAPYGYRKSPDNKHCLLPDTKTADTVRRIFTLVAAGTSTVEVARMLNAEGVPTPSQAKVGTSSEHANWADNYWRPQTVHWIIRDRQYIGSTVFGKQVRNQIGVRRQVKADLKDWIVVDDRHEPLVSKELFRAAQDQLGGEFRQTTGYAKWNSPLSKKVYCGVCEYAIVRRGKAKPYYCCATPRTVSDMECFQEKIYAEEILDAVTSAIRLQASYAVELSHIMSRQRESQEELLRTLQKELQSLLDAQERLKGYSEKLYEDLIGGLLSRDEYTRQKAALLERKETTCQREAELRQQITEINGTNSQFVTKYISHSELDELTAEIAADLLDRVTICSAGELEISLNYLDEIPTMLGLKEAQWYRATNHSGDI